MRSSIEVDRSVGEVFAFLNDFENFPRVIGNLRSVIDYQDGRAHWEAYTPTGHIVEWDTVVTKYVPRSVIAWESTSGSEVLRCDEPWRRARFDGGLANPHARGSRDGLLLAAYRRARRFPLRTPVGPAREFASGSFRTHLAHARFTIESHPLLPRAEVSTATRGAVDRKPRRHAA